MRTATPALFLFVSLFVSSLPAAAAAETAMTVGPSKAMGKNMLWNGAFDSERLRPWNVGLDSPDTGRASVTNHELCVQIDRPGSRAASVVVRQRPLALARGHHYQLRLAAHATKATRLRVRLSKINAPYTELWAGDGRGGARRADLRGDVRRHRRRRERRAGDRSRRRAGGRRAVDRLPRRRRAERSAGGAAGRTPESARAPQGARQPGRLPSRAAQDRDRRDGRESPLDWQLVDAHGRVRASGKTRPFGEDHSSGERVQQIDFSSFTATGKGYKLRVGSDESVPFDIGADVYRRLKYDALAFFYLQRSGVPIKMPYAGSPAYERAGRPPRRQERRLRAGEQVRLLARRQRRLVRRRRSRQVRRQRRLLRLDAAERVRDAVALRHDRGRRSATAS